MEMTMARFSVTSNPVTFSGDVCYFGAVEWNLGKMAKKLPAYITEILLNWP